MSDVVRYGTVRHSTLRRDGVLAWVRNGSFLWQSCMALSLSLSFPWLVGWLDRMGVGVAWRLGQVFFFGFRSGEALYVSLCCVRVFARGVCIQYVR